MASSNTRYSSLASGPTAPTAGARASSSLPTAAPLSKFKVVFVGDAGAGKTSIIKNFIYGTFSPECDSTVGIDFLSKTLYLEDRTIRLQIWDSAGQERFRSLIPSYIRDSSIAIVCYDITSRASFVNAGRWIEDVRAERGTDVLIVLVGNKTDMGDRRVVTPEEGERKAREEGVLFIECSAKTGHNVQQLFKNLSSALPGQQVASAAGGGGRVNLLPGARGGAESNLIDIKLGATPPEGSDAAGGGGAGAATGLGSYCGGCSR